MMTKSQLLVEMLLISHKKKKPTLHDYKAYVSSFKRKHRSTNSKERCLLISLNLRVVNLYQGRVPRKK